LPLQGSQSSYRRIYIHTYIYVRMLGALTQTVAARC
jgi:hypothetical protein